jgi:hypothetical protein
MEADIDRETRERVLKTYGVDLAELGRRDDIDTLIVRCVPDMEQGTSMRMQIGLRNI